MFKQSNQLLHAKRLYSSLTNPHSAVKSLDRWIASARDLKLVLPDSLRTEHLSDLYITLPTRDGTRRAQDSPINGAPLGYGHHLVFFHPRNPESHLRPDGTDKEYCPPEPFTRRMWAGGKFEWKYPLLIGEKVMATSTIESIEKKGFEKGLPLVLVNQKIKFIAEGRTEPSVVEDRVHVYLSTVGRKVRREVGTLPSPDFTFRYTPTSTTLFRFSALTFNGHHIHLDKDYAQNFEGYPERLVHGPLTALMLLEVTLFHHPDIQPKTFQYRALNPVIVNIPVVIQGAWENTSTITVWCVDANGIVGMTSKIWL